MTRWHWLANPAAAYGWRFVARVLAKAALWFAVFNVAFAVVDPIPALGRVSVYNFLVPGRARLPYGENPAQSYNLSLFNLEAMFSSLMLARPPAGDEFRVVLLGDSATWGFLLPPEATLASRLNTLALETDSGKRMRFYNVGYPEMSLLKDVLLLDEALAYEPDLIVWLVTLESFAPGRQADNALLQNNGPRLRPLVEAHDLDVDVDAEPFAQPSFWQRTIVAQRRPLADWLRLQVYGFAWAATGIDQYIPDTFDLRTSDFDDDVSWHAFAMPRPYGADEIAFDALAAGMARAGEVPVVLVNEPIFVSDGANSNLRYNLWYPRWAYDRYRELLHGLAGERGWPLVDLWDAASPREFTDSPVHMTPAGTRQLAELLAPALMRAAGG